MAFSFTELTLVTGAAAGAAAAWGAPPPGVSPAAGTSFRPAMHRAGSITADDYPAAALRDRAAGRTLVRFRIDEGGRVAACEVLASSGHPALDSASCSLIRRRYRFTPASVGGRPVPSVGTDVISWTLPRKRAAASGAAPASG